MVDDGDYIGESSIKLGGHVTIARLANVQIRTENFSFPHEVAVVKDNNPEVLVGMDVVHFKELWRSPCKDQACGDYKLTINLVIKAGSYPIPKIKDIFVSFRRKDI